MLTDEQANRWNQEHAKLGYDAYRPRYNNPFSYSPPRWPPPEPPKPPPRESLIPKRPLPFPPDVPKSNPEIVKEKPVRYLFNVFIVDPEFDLVVYNGIHIGTDDNTVRLRAALKSERLIKDIDDYDFVTVRLGSVRDKAEINAQNLQTLMLDRLGNVERQAPQIAEAIQKKTR